LLKTLPCSPEEATSLVLRTILLRGEAAAREEEGGEEAALTPSGFILEISHTEPDR
jgi:hypothetical protein